MKPEKDEIQEWLDKGNKIKVLPYHGPKNKVLFGKIRKRKTNKGSRK